MLNTCNIEHRVQEHQREERQGESKERRRGWAERCEVETERRGGAESYCLLKGTASHS